MSRPKEHFAEGQTSVQPAEAELLLNSQILEQVHDAVVATDLDGRILSWNLAADRLYGYCREEVIGLNIDILFSASGRDALNDHVRAATIASGSHDFIGRFRHRSGVSLCAEVRLSVLRGQDGRPVGIVSCSHDVTGRVEQDAAMRLQSRVLDSMGEAVFLTDASGTVLYANPAASRIFLAQQTGLVGQSIRNLVGGADPADSSAEWETIELTLRSQQEWTGELECVRLDGDRFISSLIVGEIDSSGAAGWVWVLQDVTQRRRSESALRQRERLFHSMAEKAPVMIWTTDADGDFEYVNAEWRQQWGLSIEETREGKWRDFVTPETLPDLEAARGRAIEQHEPFDVEFRMIDTNGEERVVLSHGAPLGEGAAFSGFVGSTTDITAIRQAEESRRRLDRREDGVQRLESLGVLAGGIAHDFNNLLVSILGFAELATDDLPLGHAARASVEQVEIAARRAAELTQQILTFSGRARTEPKTVNLGSLLLEMLQLLEHSLAGRARLSVESAAPTQDIVGDPSQVRQVVMNLLLNAADAIEDVPGEVRVRLAPASVLRGSEESVRTAVSPTPGEYVCIEVADNGIGMDEETQGKIFEPFFTTKPAGRGLGLASVLGIVRSHNGGIELDSRPGRGSKVRVYFPVAEPASTRPELREGVDARKRPRRNSLRVLVVDDDEAVLDTLLQLLERSGYSVRIAVDRLEAIEALSENPDAFDLIVLDLTMPGMSAAEALQRFKQINPDIPVLLATGYSIESMQGGVADRFGASLLQKPFKREELFAAIERLVCRNDETPG